MKKFLIVALSSLLFAVEEPTVCNPKIEEQKVLLFYDEDDFRALQVGDFERVYLLLMVNMRPVFLEYDDYNYRWDLSDTKESFFLEFKLIIRYNERYGVFDQISHVKSISDYPYQVQFFADLCENWIKSAKKKPKIQKLMDEGYELVEKEYGKQLTLKLKAFINHLVELRIDRLFETRSNMQPDYEAWDSKPQDANAVEYFEQLEDYIKSAGEILPIIECREKVIKNLEAAHLCVDVEHFTTKTFQDVALLIFFTNQEVGAYLKEPGEKCYMRLLTKETAKWAYKPLKDKSVEELVEIIYDTLESKRVKVLQHKPKLKYPYYDQLKEKYEKMNYRELAQWVHDVVKQAYEE